MANSGETQANRRDVYHSAFHTWYHSRIMTLFGSIRFLHSTGRVSTRTDSSKFTACKVATKKCILMRAYFRRLESQLTSFVGPFMKVH